MCSAVSARFGDIRFRSRSSETDMKIRWKSWDETAVRTPIEVLERDVRTGDWVLAQQVLAHLHEVLERANTC